MRDQIKHYPRQFNRVAGPCLILGILMLPAAAWLDNWVLGAFGAMIAGGAMACMSWMDARRMLRTRRGFGEMSGGITEEAHPFSFALHVLLCWLLTAMWAVMCGAGAFSLGKWLWKVLRVQFSS